MKNTISKGKLIHSLVYEVEYVQWRDNDVSASIEDIGDWLGTIDLYVNDYQELVIPNIGIVPVNDVIVKNGKTIIIVPINDFLNGTSSIDNNLDCQKLIATFKINNDDLITLNVG